MRQRPCKDRRIPENLMRRALVYYKCPVCKSPQEQALLWIHKKVDSKHPATHGCWCSKCRATHNIMYKLKMKRNGEPHIKIFKFFSNNEEFVKRFKVLTWCDRPSTQLQGDNDE